VAPPAADAFDARARVPAANLRDEHPRLVDLVPDHPVARAPVELERDAAERELAGERVGAAARVRERAGQRCAPDLLPREPLQGPPARKLREVPVAACHVRGGVEGGDTREQPRVAGGQEQRLLPAHRSADRVDPPPLDVDAVPRRDLRHPRQVCNLSRRAPGVSAEPPPLTGRADDGEAAEAGQLAERAGVLPRADAAAVRRDDERDRLPSVPARKEQVGGSPASVVGGVVDDAHLDRRRRGPRHRRSGPDDEQDQRHDGKPHGPEARPRIAKMAL